MMRRLAEARAGYERDLAKQRKMAEDKLRKMLQLHNVSGAGAGGGGAQVSESVDELFDQVWPRTCSRARARLLTRITRGGGAHDR